MRLLIGLLFTSALLAQEPAQSPSEFRLELRLIEPHAYRHTELIKVEVEHSGQPERSQQPRAEAYWQFGGFQIDPSVECGAAEVPCRPSQMQVGGFGRPDVNLGNMDRISTVALNNYLPNLPPGQYRVSAVARKLVLLAEGPYGSTYGYPDSPEAITSNQVAFEVLPATAQWVAQTIAGNVAVLRKPLDQGNGPGGYEQVAREREVRQFASQQLALLDTPEAWVAALSILPIEEGDLLLIGLGSSAQPGPLCDLLQTRIPLPQQAVTSRYVEIMQTNCATANLPPPPPEPEVAAVAVLVSETPFTGPVAPVDPERDAYFRNQFAYREDLADRSMDKLAASLPQKDTEAKAASIEALLTHIWNLQVNRKPPVAVPVWASTVTRELIGLLPSLENPQRRSLLSRYSSTLSGPEIASALEALLDQWQPGNYDIDPRETLEALNRADPARAQARILAELMKLQTPQPRTWLEPEMLEFLPTEEVPPMDAALIAGLEVPGDANTQLLMTALVKYGTAESLPWARDVYGPYPAACQPEMAAYFLRFDPAIAERMFAAAQVPQCAVQYMNRTAPLMMHPVLESYIAPFLMQGDVYLKSTAAKTLGRYGSATALEPLREAYQYFHDYWDGKADELALNGEGSILELDLRNAIAQGSQWFTNEADLRALEQLCISGRCVGESRQELDHWMRTLRIEIYEEGSGIRGSVAHYSRLETIRDLEEKLAQFPRGSEFQLKASGLNREEYGARIRALAARQGFTIVDE